MWKQLVPSRGCKGGVEQGAILLEVAVACCMFVGYLIMLSVAQCIVSSGGRDG
jgi:hypothetical protein